MKAMIFAAALFATPALACEPVIGAICADGEPLTEAAMIERLKGADIVILGERHDNPAHHATQAGLVATLAPGGLAFEMVPEAKSDAVNAARAEGGDLAVVLDWANSGWPDWAMYEAIFDAAPEAAVAGGGVPRDVLRRSITEGAAKAMGARGERYALNTRFDKETNADILDEQDKAHCGALPRGMLPGMAEAQQLRDAYFADAALRLHEAGARPVVLITGNGHARVDRGVPLYLRRAAPELTVVSVGQVEVPGGGSLPYDIEIFTEPFDRGDPCAKFIESRQKQ